MLVLENESLEMSKKHSLDNGVVCCASLCGSFLLDQNKEYFADYYP